MGQSVKVAVSLPSDIFYELNKLAKQRGKSRSAIVKDALSRFLLEEVDEETEARARVLYEKISNEDRAIAEKFLGVIKEDLPPYITNKKD